jgi:large subunit ribosomal protein L10
VAKALRDFARGNPSLVVKGGVLGTRILTAADAGALAELPSRDELLARIAGALAAPMQQFASLLQAVPAKFAYAVQALIDQKGGVPEAAAEPEPEPVAIAEEPEAAASEPEPEAAEPEPEPEPEAAAEPQAEVEAVAEPEAPAEPEVTETVENAEPEGEA